MNSSPVAGSRVTRATRGASSMKRAGIIRTSLSAAPRANHGVSFGVTGLNLGKTRPDVRAVRALSGQHSRHLGVRFGSVNDHRVIPASLLSLTGHERTFAIDSFGELGDQGLMADQLVEDSGSDCRATCAARPVWPRATWSPSLSSVTSAPAASTTPVPSAMGIRPSTAGCCPVTHA
jgi:hypothetical protein